MVFWTRFPVENDSAGNEVCLEMFVFEMKKDWRVLRHEIEMVPFLTWRKSRERMVVNARTPTLDSDKSALDKLLAKTVLWRDKKAILLYHSHPVTRRPMDEDELHRKHLFRVETRETKNRHCSRKDVADRGK